MEINDHRPVEGASRRRPADAPRGAKPAPESPPPSARAANRADLRGVDPAAITRLVGILQAMGQSDAQRVDDLRARIADGSYTASPEEIADLLLGRPGNADGDQSGP